MAAEFTSIIIEDAESGIRCIRKTRNKNLQVVLSISSSGGSHSLTWVWISSILDYESRGWYDVLSNF